MAWVQDNHKILDNSDNTIVIASFESTTLDVDTITNTAGDTWRYTMNGTPDLSGVSVGDYIKVSNSTNSANDGYFAVTAVDDGSDYIEVTNASGVAEATDSPAEIQLQIQSDDTLTAGDKRKYICYNDLSIWREFNQ